MLKTLVCILPAVLLLGACQEKNAAPATGNDAAQTQTAASSADGDGAQSRQAAAVHADLQPFADLTAQVRAELEQGGDAVPLYLRHRSDVGKWLDRLHESDTGFLKDAPDIKDLPQKEAALQAVGLTYVYAEGGSAAIAPVAGYYAALFGNAAAADLRGFLALERVSFDYPESPAALGRHIAAWEDWVAAFPRSRELNRQAAAWLKSHRLDYLQLNPDVHHDPAEVEKEWLRFAAERPNSETAQLIGEARRYQKALQESGGEPDLSGYSAPFKNLRQYD